MTDTNSPPRLPPPPAAIDCEVSRTLLPWLTAALGGDMRIDGETLTVRWGEEDERAIEAPLAQWRWGADAASQLWNAYRASGRELHAQPCGQPARVHEFSDSLLGPYSADGGRVHLGGCTLEWSPVWRQIRLDANGAEESATARLSQRYLHENGETLEGDEIAAGGLESLALLSSAPAAGAAPPETDDTVLLNLPIWRTWVRGRVVAEIGEQSMTVDVEGWASEIARGAVQLPPFDIGSGQPSYRAALDDDGDIGPDAAIAICAESKRHLLCSKMQRCGASEVWVLAKHVHKCPVTGVAARANELIECNMCGQRVAPQAISSARCEVCRSLRAAPKEDAQVARIIGEFPRLDEYSGWRIGESRDCLVMTAGRWLWRLLVVFKKEPLELVHAATGLRWIRGWSEASDELKRELSSR